MKRMVHTPNPTGSDEPVCGRCTKCHPGKQWGGDERCRALTDARSWVDCACHRRPS